MKSPVEQYIEKAKNWQEEMSLLRSILLECPLNEVVKWGKPCYTSNDKNIVIIQNFKHHCDLGFFNGASLSDLKQLLVKAGEHTQAGRQLRFKDLEDIKKKKNLIKAYVKEAIENEKKGNKIVVEDITTIEPVVELNTIFKKNKPFEKAFNKLTTGRQRAYHMFFASAKQSETRISRIEKFIPRILDGKGMNDCTCGLSKRMPNCDGSHKYQKTK
jgi:uncharacterized protein YdeI (YjbR/CyaY-like superfamily)